ncbi:MAG: hypothetical protein H0Z37_11865 [Firmicutes bacterium]|nr:hypothetical protein [Bacillota bacterium]
MLRAIAVRAAALYVFGTVLIGQAAAVYPGGVLEDPAVRILTELGAEVERTAITAAVARDSVPEPAMAELKRQASRVAAAVGRSFGVAEWRLGNRVEGPGRAVYFHGRTAAGDQATAVAWHGPEGGGWAAALIRTGPSSGTAAARLRLARAVAQAAGVPPRLADTGIAVRGTAWDRTQAVLEAMLAGGAGGRMDGLVRRRLARGLDIELEPADGGTRVCAASAMAGEPAWKLASEVMW